jgi:hypothetical protein
VATLFRVEARLAGRVAVFRYFLHQEGLKSDITDGWRPYSDQLFVWDRWQRGIRQHGSEGAAMRAGVARAAPPGYSDHGKVINWVTKEQADSTAVDVALKNPTPTNIKRYGQIAKRCGLKQTVRGEYWHVQLDLSVETVPNIPVKEEVDDMPKPDSRVDACRAPHGGVWTLTYDGGIRATGGAPFYGSYPGLPAAARKGSRNFIAIEAEGDGYTIFSDDDNGSTYHFDPEVWAELQRAAK